MIPREEKLLSNRSPLPPFEEDSDLTPSDNALARAATDPARRKTPAQNPNISRKRTKQQWFLAAAVLNSFFDPAVDATRCAIHTFRFPSTWQHPFYFFYF
jgi:hypothetical protein